MRRTMAAATVIIMFLLVMPSTAAIAARVSVGLLPFIGNASSEHRAAAQSRLSSILDGLDRFNIRTYKGGIDWCCDLNPNFDQQLAQVGRDMQVEIVFAGRIDDLYVNWEKPHGKNDIFSFVVSH